MEQSFNPDALQLDINRNINLSLTTMNKMFMDMKGTLVRQAQEIKKYKEYLKKHGLEKDFEKELKGPDG